MRSRADAVRMLEWYAMRWRIETFHKILKSGCHAEDSKLRAATRLTNFLAILCVVSWRIFWLTMINRAAPGAPATLAFMPSQNRAARQAARQRSRIDLKRAGTGDLYHSIGLPGRLSGTLARSAARQPGDLARHDAAAGYRAWLYARRARSG